MGKNVLSLPANDEWAKHRRLLSPLFAEKFMRSYCTLMSPKLSAMSARIRRDAAANGGSVDVLRVVMATALVKFHEYSLSLLVKLPSIKFNLHDAPWQDIIGACGFGVDFGSVETNSNSKFSAASEALLEEIIRLTFVPWIYELLDVKNWFKLSRAKAVLESTCDDVRRTSHAKNEVERQTMLSELLEMESIGEFTSADVNSDMVDSCLFFEWDLLCLEYNIICVLLRRRCSLPATKRRRRRSAGRCITLRETLVRCSSDCIRKSTPRLRAKIWCPMRRL